MENFYFFPFPKEKVISKLNEIIGKSSLGEEASLYCAKMCNAILVQEHLFPAEGSECEGYILCFNADEEESKAIENIFDEYHGIKEISFRRQKVRKKAVNYGLDIEDKRKEFKKLKIKIHDIIYKGKSAISYFGFDFLPSAEGVNILKEFYKDIWEITEEELKIKGDENNDENKIASKHFLINVKVVAFDEEEGPKPFIKEMVYDSLLTKRNNKYTDLFTIDI